MEHLGVQAVRLRQLADGIDREAWHGEPDDTGRRRELAEHDPQRMVARDLVVPVGRDHERPRAVDAPAEHAQGVEGGAVRPVHVLEHEHAAAAERGRRDRAWLARLEAEVEEGPQRGRRSEALARASGGIPDAVREGAHERGLADARLAADEHEPPALRAERSELRQ